MRGRRRSLSHEPIRENLVDGLSSDGSKWQMRRIGINLGGEVDLAGMSMSLYTFCSHVGNVQNLVSGESNTFSATIASSR